MHLTRNVIYPLLHRIAPNRTETLTLSPTVVYGTSVVAFLCTESHRIRNQRDTISDTSHCPFFLLNGSSIEPRMSRIETFESRRGTCRDRAVFWLVACRRDNVSGHARCSVSTCTSYRKLTKLRKT